jgi:hypothetical protein
MHVQMQPTPAFDCTCFTRHAKRNFAKFQPQLPGRGSLRRRLVPGRKSSTGLLPLRLIEREQDFHDPKTYDHDTYEMT